MSRPQLFDDRLRDLKADVDAGVRQYTSDYHRYESAIRDGESSDACAVLHDTAMSTLADLDKRFLEFARYKARRRSMADAEGSPFRCQEPLRARPKPRRAPTRTTRPSRQPVATRTRTR